MYILERRPCDILCQTLKTSKPRHMNVKTARADLNETHVTARPFKHRDTFNTSEPPRRIHRYSSLTTKPPTQNSQTCRSSKQHRQHERPSHPRKQAANQTHRVRTLTGKEIELDIESDYKVRPPDHPEPSEARSTTSSAARKSKARRSESAATSRLSPSESPQPRLHALALLTGQIADLRLVRKQVQRIKERVEEKEGIPPLQQRLIYGGKQM